MSDFEKKHRIGRSVGRCPLCKFEGSAWEVFGHKCPNPKKCTCSEFHKQFEKDCKHKNCSRCGGEL